MSTHVVILGAGFGGLELSSRLSAELADEVHVTLIDQSDSFIFGFSKLDVMFGRRTMDEVRIPYRDITRPGVTFRQESVLSIDPGRKRVVTNAGGYDADVLVVALGADLAPEATPGVDECGHEFYSPDGAARVRDLLPAFPGGNVVIAVLGGFFKCPPAPYETAVIAEGEAATVADAAHRPYHRRPAAGALPRRNDLLHRDGRGHRRHSRRELPVRAGTHRTFHPAVARRGRGQTPLRRLSPRSLVRSRIRRKPARWHDPRFSVTT